MNLNQIIPKLNGETVARVFSRLAFLLIRLRVYVVLAFLFVASIEAHAGKGGTVFINTSNCTLSIQYSTGVYACGGTCVNWSGGFGCGDTLTLSPFQKVTIPGSYDLVAFPDIRVLTCIDVVYAAGTPVYFDCNGIVGAPSRPFDDDDDLPPDFFNPFDGEPGSPTGDGDIKDYIPPSAPPDDSQDCGMPTWHVSEPFISLWLEDEPLGYKPAVGPRVSFEINFKQRGTDGSVDTNIFSVGARWNSSWLSYIIPGDSGNVVQLSGGGRQTYFGTNIDFIDNTFLTGDATNGFILHYPDGSRDVYGFGVTNSAGVFQKSFLTERWNPQSQKLTLAYYGYTPSDTPVIRLRYVVDGDGKTNSIYYVATNAYSTNLISQVVDAYGRTNSLTYDNNGQLTNSTDVVGIPSSFLYDSAGCVTNLTTPYGTTSFEISETLTLDNPPDGLDCSIRVTEPDGSKELFMYKNAAPGIPNQYVYSPLVTYTNIITTNLVINSGAELPLTNGWTQISGSWAQANRTVNDADEPEEGLYHFFAGAVASAELDQDVDLSGYATQIDAGQIYADFSGYVASYSGDDESRIVVEYRDNSTNILSTYDTGNLTPIDWTLESDFRLVPSSSRIARIRLVSTRVVGSDNDGYYDGLSLSLNTLSVYTNIYETTNQVPSVTNFSTSLNNTNLDVRNSFHWGRRQYAALSTTNIASLTMADFRKAHMQHWLRATTNLVGTTASLKRAPSLDANGVYEGQKTWFDYAGQTNVEYEGTQRLPLTEARVLPDNTTVFSRSLRNWLGTMTNEVTSYSGTAGILLRTNIYTYSTNGVDLFTVTNALGVRVVSNRFNAFHQMVTNFNALNEHTDCRYDSTQRLASITFPNGQVQTNIYGANGFLSEQRLIGISTNFFTYTNGLPLSHTDERGLVTTNTWDSLQRLTSLTFPDGTYVSNRYSALDLIATKDRLGNWSYFGYDAMRRKVAETNALGFYTLYSYCICGALDSVRDAVGNHTYFYYDNGGEVTNTVYADGYTVANFYDLFKRVTNSVDSAGVSVTNWFNNQGLNYASSNAFGRVFLNTYDILDRVTNAMDANGVTVAATFDNLTRPLTRTYPDGGVEKFGYTVNVTSATSYTNQLGNVIVYAYDLRGLKTNEIFVGITTNKYSYSPSGNLLTFIDGKSQTNKWNYDTFGRATNKLDAAGITNFVYTFDANGRMTNRWTPAKGNASYSYDALGELLAITYQTSPGVSFSYDALNRRTNMVDAVGTTKFDYTVAGQILDEDGPWSNDIVSYGYSNRQRISLTLQQPAGSWTNGYAYDTAGRLKTLTSPAGSFGYTYDVQRHTRIAQILLPGASSITNAFDSNARLLSTTLKNSGLAALNSHAYQINLGGQRTNQTRISQVFSNGTLVSATNSIAYTYDAISQLKTAVGKEINGTNRWLEQFGYVYDPAGNLTSRTNNTLVQTFRMNALNQLTNVTRAGNATIAGGLSTAATNVTINTSNAVRYLDNTFASTNQPLANGTNIFTAIAKDQAGHADTNLVTSYLPATNNYSYDQNGNLRTNGNQVLDYDDENELIRVTVIGAWKSEFTYDGQNRRRIEQDYSWNPGTSSWSQTNETHFVYDGNLVIQHRGSNNVPLMSLTRGIDLSGTMFGAGGIGGLLAMTEHSASGSQLSSSYYHSDGNGNVTALVSGSGIVVARYLYDPFGNTLAMTGPKASVNLYRFSSKPVHEGSGMYDFLRRWYAPDMQRFINRDPMGEPGGNNLYAYCGNNPILLFDLWGLCPPTLADLWLQDIKQNWLQDTADYFEGVGQGADGLANMIEHPIDAVQNLGTFAGNLYGDPSGTANGLLNNLGTANGIGQTVFAIEFGLAAGGAGAVPAAPEAVAVDADAGLSGTALARQLGQEGEDAANIIKNTERIPSLTGTANYRVPDVLDHANGIIGDVKNVGNLSYTSQLRDFVAYANKNDLQFELTVRPSTQLSGPLQQAVQNGSIVLKYLPK